MLEELAFLENLEKILKVASKPLDYSQITNNDLYLLSLAKKQMISREPDLETRKTYRPTTPKPKCNKSLDGEKEESESDGERNREPTKVKEMVAEEVRCLGKWDYKAHQKKLPSFSQGFAEFEKFKDSVQKYLFLVQLANDEKIKLVHSLLDGVAGRWSQAWLERNNTQVNKNSFETYFHCLNLRF
jgi:hypothetical protein